MSIPAVEPFRQDGDFGRWLRGVERYLSAVGIQEADRKCAMLLHLVGPDIADLSETLPEETSGTADIYERLKMKLMTYLSPVRNAVAERSTFHGMQMEPEEDLERFLGRLRAQVVRCGYSATEVDRELRDRCVLGSRAGLRAKLVQLAASKGDGLTLAEVRQTARAHRDLEQLGAQLAGTRLTEAPAADAEGAVNAVKTPQSRRGPCFRCGAAGHWQRDCPAAGGVPRARDCPAAGAVPRARDGRCPACQAANCGRSGAAGEHGRGAPGNSNSDGGTRQRRCYKCGATGHLRAACPRRRVRLVSAEEPQPDDSWLVSSVNLSSADSSTVVVDGVPLSMIVDTGSPVSLISAETARQRRLLELLEPSALRLTSFTGQVIPLRGEALVTVRAAGRPSTRLRLVVTDFGPHRALMGREWIQALDILPSPPSVNQLESKQARTLEAVLDKHSAVFSEEMGHIPIKVGLPLKPDARPVYRRARPVPLALQDAVDKELDAWEQQGVAEKVPPGSGWGTPLVVIPRQNGVRICADYRLTVNPQLSPLKYPMRTAEELFSGIRGKRFAKLDCRNAYLQVELDEASKNATTVTTHRGDYRMNRLPYGISVCGALFQSVIDQITAGLPGTVSYLDDVLVWADTEDELLQRLEATLGRMEEYGIRLRRDKCCFNVPEVTYLGWRLSADSLRPLAGKTESVLHAPDPKNQQELKSLIGTVSYYQRILPGLATVLTPLYALLKKGVRWHWTDQCAAAVSEVKKMLSSAPVLVRFSPDRPVKLVTDASETGLGAVLMQVTADGLEKPVQYASRTLTQTERKYAQVEKEAAAVSFGIRRFHQFLMGRRFTLVVDNRTLSRIISPDRELPTLAAARMQRYALQLAAYQYDVELRRTEDMRAADTLSRLPVSSPAEERQAADEEAEYGGGGVMFVVHEQGPCLSARAIAAATRTDPVLGRVLAAVRSGWPNTVDTELTPYKRRADELSTDADCVLWGGRVVVPRALRDRVKIQLHDGHVGCTKMKQLARRFVWWPGLDAELEALARNCPACDSKRAAPPHAERHPWEPAQGPWQRVHADFAGPISGHWFLVMIDSYTKWAEMIAMRTTTSERTAAVMRTVFARLGLPLVLVTDNGPQFASQEFAQFTASNGIRHIRVAPHHPSSNGLAERAVGTLKSSLKATLAAGGGGVELALARVLMAYRATPHASTGRTPAEMLFGRSIRTRLNLLVPTAEDALRDSAERQRTAAGGRARAFGVGAEVWARCYGGPHKWIRGRVVTQTGPVSYEVDVGRGSLWSRHCDQLLSAAPGNTAAAGEGREEAEPGSQQTEADQWSRPTGANQWSRRTGANQWTRRTGANQWSRRTEADPGSRRTAVEASQGPSDDGRDGAVPPAEDGSGELTGGSGEPTSGGGAGTGEPTSGGGAGTGELTGGGGAGTGEPKGGGGAGTGEPKGGGGAGTGEPAGGGAASASEPDFDGLASEAEAGSAGRAGSPRRCAQPGAPRRSTRRCGARSRKCPCGGV